MKTWNQMNVHVGAFFPLAMLGEVLGFEMLGSLDLEHKDGPYTTHVRYNLIQHNGNVVAIRGITPHDADLDGLPDPDAAAAELWNNASADIEFPVDNIDQDYLANLIAAHQTE